MLLKKISFTLAVCAGGGVVAGGCGDDDGGGAVDARRSDAAQPDADTTPDAATVNYVGTFSLLEAQVLQRNASGDVEAFGQGPSFRMAFVDPAAVGAPVLEESPGSPFGCKAFEYTPAQFAATLGADLGTIDIEFAGGPPVPVVPSCVFVPGSGYACPDTTTAGVGDNAVIAAVGGPVYSYTDPDVTYTAAAVGRYLKVTGATDAGNNGAFPIVNFNPGAAHTVFFASGGSVAAAVVGGTSITIAGVGPIPSAPDPGFIADDATLTVDFASSNIQAFPNFTGTLGGDGVGDDFTLDAASQLLLTGIPTDGGAFTIDVESPSGDAQSSVLNILTTDGAVAGLSSFAMPPPVTKAVLVRCTSPLAGGTGVTIPAAYSAYIMSAGATRIQATFVRGSLGGGTGIPSNKLTIVAGHSSVGFTTILPTAQ